MARRSLPLMLLLLLGMCACTAAAGRQGPVRTNTVTMPKSYRFDPPTIQVAAGTTVTWSNQDNFTHNVHILGEENFNSPPVRPGESTTYVFSRPGEYAYECSFHPQNMKGKVIVTAP